MNKITRKKPIFKNIGNKEISLLIVFALVLMPIFGSTVATSEDSGTEITSLPFTADVPGQTYYLTKDLTCSDSGAAGIAIAADGITIDGKSHKITGTATPSDCEWFGETEPCTASGIYNPGYDNVVIENIKITGFGTGIALKGTGANKIQNNIVDNCDIYDNGFSITSGGSEMVTHGIHACWLAQGNSGNPALKIINCNIYNNKGTGSSCGDGGNGVFIYAGSPNSKEEYVVISNNQLYGNAKAGFWTKMMLSKSQITSNIVYENGNGKGVTDPTRGGIVLRCKLSDFNTIEGNRIYDNNGDGIYVGGNSNELVENIVRDNYGNGINLGRSDGSQNNEFYHNYICGHTGGYYDVNNFYADGGGNTGDNNAGSTAYNYHDEGTNGFTYPCNPDTTIIDGPSGTIEYNDVTFTWTGNGYVTPSQGLQFSYKLDGYDNSWSSWMDSTSKTYHDLDNGQYTFKVKSKDAAGNIDSTPATTSFTVDVSTSDTTPPDTTITDGPTGIIEYNDVTFTWSGSDDTTSSANLRYSYKLVGYDNSWSPWTKSTSKSYDNLPNGQYTFKVKAKDEADNVDSSPAQRSFTVDVSTSDTTPPDTTITDGPSGTIEYNDVAFTWGGSDDVTPPSNIIYSYKLQGYDSSWSPWTTSKSKSYTDLDNGTYTFKVKAKDESGNVDPTPAERIFVINISDDLKTCRITWDIVKKEIQLDNPFYVNKPRLKIGISKDFPFIKIVRKDNPFIKTVKIDEYNLKSINFKLTWKDDLTTSVFPYGKDTLTFSIKSPDGEEIYNKKNKEQGTLNFEKNNINDEPTIDIIKARDDDDAEEKLMKFYNSNWKNKSIELQVTIKIGEIRLLKRIHERGNNFNLNISYEFYKPNITKEDNPPDTRIRSRSFGVINTNKIELKWLGEDDETSVEELMYSYLLQEKDSKSKSSWSCWTSDTSKIFSDLADGDYKFLVRTKDNDGNIDPTPAQQSFTINFEHNRNDMEHNNSFPKNNKNGTLESSSSGETESQEAQVPGFEFLSFLLVILIGIFIYKISRKRR